MADEQQSAGIKQKESNLDMPVEKNYYKWLLVVILIFAFIVRIYYFYLTRNQTLWWDEAEYMSIAKHWLYHLDYAVNPQRPPLFPLLEYILLGAGFGELAIKLILSLLPSVGVVYITYLLGKEFYDERVGLVAAFITSSFWVLTFNSVRIHTDILGLLFGMLAIYYFEKCFVKQESKNKLWLVGFFLGLAFATRLASFLFAFLIILGILIYNASSIVKNWKRLAIMTLAGLIIFVAYLVWAKLYFGEAFLFLKMNAGAITGVQQAPAWIWLTHFLEFNRLVFFILFLLGAVLFILDFLLGFDILVKGDNIKLKNKLFTGAWIVIIIFYFVFIIRSPTTDHRWTMPMAPPIFMIVGAGIVYVYNLIRKHNRLAALLVCALLLFGGTYQQLNQADFLITLKMDSYSAVKEAALWMKEYSSPNDYLVTWSVPQTLYYSDRKQLSGFETESEFEDKVRIYRPKYLTLSAFEVHANWIYDYPQRHSNSLVPVQAYFFDKERRQTALVIYEFKNYSL